MDVNDGLKRLGGIKKYLRCVRSFVWFCKLTCDSGLPHPLIRVYISAAVFSCRFPLGGIMALNVGAVDGRQVGFVETVH